MHLSENTKSNQSLWWKLIPHCKPELKETTSWTKAKDLASSPNLCINICCWFTTLIQVFKLHAVSRSDGHLTGIQEVHSFVEIGRENISMAILSLPLIQEGQLSVTCKRMCTKYWLTTSKPAQEKCGKV